MDNSTIDSQTPISGSVNPYVRKGFYGKEHAAVDFALKQFDASHTLNVLDIGCASGRTSREFIDLYGAKLVGIDIDQATIADAQQRIPEGDFRVMDACNLGELADSSFDFVFFSFNGIDYITEKKRRDTCLREIHRVLKPGGFFAFSSHNLWGLFSNRDSRRILRNNWQKLLSGKRFLTEKSSHWAVTLYHGTLRSEREDLHSAGFDLMRVVMQNGNLLPLDASWKCRDHWPYYVAKRRGACGQ